MVKRSQPSSNVEAEDMAEVSGQEVQSGKSI